MSNVVLLVAAGLILVIEVGRFAAWRLRNQEREHQQSLRPINNRYYNKENQP